MEQSVSGLSLELEMTKAVNYALQQNRLPVVLRLVIRNDSETDQGELDLYAYSEPGVFSPVTRHIQMIPAGTELEIRDLELRPDPDYLAGLTERVAGTVYLSLNRGQETLAYCQQDFTALAFDEWHGAACCPELLAAFVTPNHPAIGRLTAQGAGLLENWTGDPSLDGYQRKDPNRVRLQAAAAYGAMQRENLVYAVPPASFETVGQRVRLADALLEQKLGTCLDLTLAYAACLEAMGLNPLLILQPGHIFAGVWLEEMTFPEAVQDDPALLTKRLADGVGELTVVECTALTAGRQLDFEAAEAAARQELAEQGVSCIIDVARTRRSGIRPLPQRVRGDRGYAVVRETPESLTAAPRAMDPAVAVAEGKGAAGDRLTIWERKLLDLGLRNNLISLRLTKTILPLLTSSLGELEDALSQGGEYGIGPRPGEWETPEGAGFETLGDPGRFRELLQSEFQNKRLRAAVGEGELNRAIVDLYRAAKTSLEENGANTLYLALGLLKWFETKSSRKPRYAPVVLLPVEIVRKSALKGYVIRLRDEEPQMNITLLEMLRQDFGITVSGLDPLPGDENGVDMRGVFSTLRRAVMDQRGWDVLETAVLGIFSFSQFVMWNDLRNRTEDLKKNKVVRSLMEGRLAWEAEPMELGASVPEDGVFLPLPADASQLFAIRAAAQGESFVLHGPPGTGKSQTITALIANSMAQGKTVLFVAEKMAALEVVQRRLEKIGIGPFCLELHSNKSRKRDVLEQLRQASEVTKEQPGEAFDREAERTAALRRELDSYARALHVLRPSGLSLYDMVSRYEGCRGAKEDISFPVEFARSLKAEDLGRNEGLVGRLTAAGRAVGHPHEHPLSAVGLTSYRHSLRGELEPLTRAYDRALAEWEASAEALTGALGMEKPVTRDQWTRLGDIARELKGWLDYPAAWAESRAPGAQTALAARAAAHMAAAASLAGTLAEGWNESFLELNGEDLLARWQSSRGKWALARALEQSRVRKLLSPCAKGRPEKEAIDQALTLLVQYRRERAAGEALLEQCPELPTDAGTDWAALEAMARAAGESAAHLDALAGGDGLRRRFGGRKALAPQLETFFRCSAQENETRSALFALLEIEEDRLAGAELTAGRRQLCRELLTHQDELREWTLWRQTCREAEEHGLAPVVRAYEGGLAHEELRGAYERGLYRSLVESTMDADPALSSFSGALFGEKIRQFRRMDRELEELARREIYCRLAARVPNFAREAAHSSEVGILQRAIRSGGRGVSIRRLFEQIPNLLPKLCPCMLMSPLSAAQYLDAGRKPFDIVVFDEASQLPTCKAVGALARGENAVIVGDPKQMPPTSFFTGNTVDEENLDREDLESILEDCLALHLPQTYLLWHYRSRHESLIAFSNREFYENKLYTFPSVNDLMSKVTLTHVDGVFDRGGTRQNRAEAEAVVRELQRRCHDPAAVGQSVGVVTFNIQQQNLIDDLFSEKCREDGALEAWAYGGEEPLFIKNLENVQGDERDVILFSVGFGPDQTGKVTMNFGPLNREGGWRRLNVAVSRARQGMQVFATLQPEQIDLSRSASQGVAALRAFLEYARSGRLPQTEGETSRAMQAGGVALSIQAALRDNGYEARTMIGRSGFRVDVAVVDPEKPEQYILGILLDGPAYGQAKTTRDREIAQCTILESLGWRLHRVWTADWWDNREKELGVLLDCIRKAQAKEKAPAELTESEPAPLKRGERLASAKAVRIPAAGEPQTEPYRPVRLDCAPMSAEALLAPENTKQVRQMLEEILKGEAPISQALLLRRLLQAVGIPRAGTRIQERIEMLLNGMKLGTTDQGGMRFYWLPDQDPERYDSCRPAREEDGRREPRDVPEQETASAIRQILAQQVGLPREDLLRLTAKTLGYPRMGTQVSAMAESGLRWAMSRGQTYLDDRGYVQLREKA